MVQSDSFEVEKHSGLGIASFITAIFSGCFIFVIMIIAGVIEISNPGGMDENSAAAIIIGLFIIIFLGTALLGLGLGIASLIQKNRKKIFGILGTIISLITFLGTVFLIILGLSIE